MVTNQHRGKSTPVGAGVTAGWFSGRGGAGAGVNDASGVAVTRDFSPAQISDER